MCIRRPVRPFVALSLATVLAMTAGSLGTTAHARSQEPTQLFGRDYSDLSAEQRALLDDLFRRFGEVANQTIDPAEAYELTRMSARTTFEAVTHAL